MDESEKLTALKKAYADIILNTAKEAAARVIVAERKALRSQRELFSTKDEAFRMLLRLKHILDSKVGEAKTMSLSQQKKIDELEAQLQEAEDIVKDLREELSEVQAQLEKATSNQGAPPVEERNLEADAAAAAAPGLLLSQPNLQPDVVTNGECNSLKDRYYVHNPDFASLVMRSKEPELYRNGCTQRIRAFERNLLDEKLSLSGLVDDAKNATFIKSDDEDKGMCKKAKREVDKTPGVENNLEELKVMKVDGSHIQAPAFKSFQTKRKRAARYRRSIAPSCRYLPHQFMEVRQLSHLSCSRRTTDNGSKKPENEIQEVTAGCANVTGKNEEFVRACSVQKETNNDKTFKEESTLTRHKYLSSESLEVLTCKTDVEKDIGPVDKSDKKASDVDDGTVSEPANTKFLKYTFRRKRKKDALSSPESKSHVDNDTLESNNRGEQNGSLEPQKSSLLIESSRDSRRLAQVARQLISLSEKKWWK